MDFLTSQKNEQIMEQQKQIYSLLEKNLALAKKYRMLCWIMCIILNSISFSNIFLNFLPYSVFFTLFLFLMIFLFIIMSLNSQILRLNHILFNMKMNHLLSSYMIGSINQFSRKDT